jgi:hypothetical protein
MTMAAKARGFDAIRDVPADRFDEVRDSLVKRKQMIDEREAGLKQTIAGGEGDGA